MFTENIGSYLWTLCITLLFFFSVCHRHGYNTGKIKQWWVAPPQAPHSGHVLTESIKRWNTWHVAMPWVSCDASIDGSNVYLIMLTYSRQRQLQHRMRAWNLKRKLRKQSGSASWQYISHHVKRRKEQGKDSKVLLNGRVLAPTTVSKEVNRISNQPSYLQKISQGIYVGVS